MSDESRIKAAIALLACFGLASSFLMLRSARREANSGNLGRDPVTLFGMRLQNIRRDLPRYGIIGYVADCPDQILANPELQELVWTRYYLAPLIVVPDVQHHLVIGNFHKLPPTELLSHWHLALIRDYGNGLMLFVKQER